MIVAALYDIHANLPALEAVLEDVRDAGVDRIVVGGDVVPGPMPRETLERLLGLDLPTHFICGNGDREVLAGMRGVENARLPEPVREGIRWSGEQISGEQIHATTRGRSRAGRRRCASRFRGWAPCCSATRRRGMTLRSSPA